MDELSKYIDWFKSYFLFVCVIYFLVSYYFENCIVYLDRDLLFVLYMVLSMVYKLRGLFE